MFQLPTVEQPWQCSSYAFVDDVHFHLFLHFSRVKFDLHYPLSKSWPEWDLRLSLILVVLTANYDA